MTEREDKTETESETETRTETETDTDDTTESVEDEEESETEERLDKNADVEQGQEDVIYKNDFNNLETGKPLTDNEGEKGIIAELSNGNMAVVYDVDLSQPDKDDSPWSTAFQADLSLPDMYNVSSAEKLTMSYDVYIPTSNTDIGTLTAQAILRNGDRWEWKQANTMESYTNSNLVSGEIDGYSKISVSIEIIKGDDWKLKDITSLKAITAGLAGNPSSYKGKLYLDNVVLKDTSTKTETPEPEEPTTPVNEEVFYENNFDTVEKLEDVVNINDSLGSAFKDGDNNVIASIAELNKDNKAIKLTADVSTTNAWQDIFKIVIDLKDKEFTKTISEKVVMSYDLYFPADSVGENFGTMSAIGSLKSGENWTWITEKNGVPFGAEQWAETSDVGGYKVFHAEINMNDFKTWNQEENKDEDFGFEGITPIKSVIPSLGISDGTYNGDIYLDNLKVKAVGVTADGGNTEDPDKPGEEEPTDKYILYSMNFDKLDSLEGVLQENVKNVTPVLAELVTGNKAVKYTVDLPGTGTWEEIFKPSLILATPNNTPIKGKVAMSYDVYFPSESIGETFGKIKAQAAFKSGDNGTKWVSQQSWPDCGKEDLEEDEKVPGFKKFHVEIDIDNLKDGESDYPIDQLTPLHAVIPCLAGEKNPYKGDVYLDNVELKIVEGAGDDNPGEEENPPTVTKELIYENDFNELASLENVLTENVSGRTPELAVLATGNKAVKYTISALSGSGWDDIFKAQFNLAEAYDKQITEKVVMSYDVYFPAASVTAESFNTIKAQATVASGSAWAWATQKTWPEITVETLEDDAEVPNFKKAHVEIDMNDLQVWDNELKDNKPYPFDQITPIHAVIPCLAGAGSTYSGDLYLDNLKVWAVNETSETPDPTEDVVLNLDASAWTVGGVYQYDGESKIENKTVGDKKFLVATVDYSKNTNTGWRDIMRLLQMYTINRQTRQEAALG